VRSLTTADYDESFSGMPTTYVEPEHDSSFSGASSVLDHQEARIDHDQVSTSSSLATISEQRLSPILCSLDLSIHPCRSFCSCYPFSRIRWYIPRIDVQRMSRDLRCKLLDRSRLSSSEAYVGWEAKFGRPGNEGT
jgi:hypothetical protein